MSAYLHKTIDITPVSTGLILSSKSCIIYFMWTRWLPWRIIIKNIARKHGFIDPIQLVSALNRVAQPSEVLAPVELLRLAAVLHARGLINSQIIQNNLDWIWPYWIQQQFYPQNKSFIPRAFSITHINLTHRNWTAVGVPGIDSFPLVDPRGLVTPLYDGWSIDSWLATESGYRLLPSMAKDFSQALKMDDNLCVVTDIKDNENYIKSRVELENQEKNPKCKITVIGSMIEKGCLVVCLRPFNPEGISFIHGIASTQSGWLVNDKDNISFKDPFQRQAFSNYRKGDIANHLFELPHITKIKCDVGLCTAAAIFDMEAGSEKTIEVGIELGKDKSISKKTFKTSKQKWTEATLPATKLCIPDKKFEYLYNTSLRSILLLSPDDIYAGPYTYKQFWFRDAVYAIHAMLLLNLHKQAKTAIDSFLCRQTAAGYFKSQDGEWDSNGQVLWIMNIYCQLTGEAPDKRWGKPIIHALNWIKRKRKSKNQPDICAGLLPAGFSAEHFGPNDYYYWDDFWAVAGLDAGRVLLDKMDIRSGLDDYVSEKESFLSAINTSVEKVQKKHSISAIPSSPFRRLDSSAVGTLVASYPLKIYTPDDKNIKKTADYLIDECFFNGLFFHEIAHSGINIYLSLQIAQVLLRCNDPRYFDIIASAADIASGTGQWPEAIHPWTGGGCMGDGQHLWASSEWIIMMYSFFVREEEGLLILCSGIPEHWLKHKEDICFGPAPTSFGNIAIRIACSDMDIKVYVEGNWRFNRPDIECRLPGYTKKKLDLKDEFVVLKKDA
jgi:hypothetical protein